MGYRQPITVMTYGGGRFIIGYHTGVAFHRITDRVFRSVDAARAWLKLAPAREVDA